MEENRFLSEQRIAQLTFDPETNSMRTSQAVTTEFSVELSHVDGDSVFAVKRSLMLDNTTVNAQGYSTICLYAAGTLEVSPSDSGEDFITIAQSVGQVVSICARRVRVSVKAVMNG